MWERTSSKIIELYARHGLTITQTCMACPEQYDVFFNGAQVAYYRLRGGWFSVELTDEKGQSVRTIHVWSPKGDGAFDADERYYYLKKAMRKVLKSIKPMDTKQRDCLRQLAKYHRLVKKAMEKKKYPSAERYLEKLNKVIMRLAVLQNT